MKKATGKDYYALLCACSAKKNPYMICGVSGSRREAKELGNDILNCVAKHSIKKVNVTVTWK